MKHGLSSHDLKSQRAKLNMTTYRQEEGDKFPSHIHVDIFHIWDLVEYWVSHTLFSWDHWQHWSLRWVVVTSHLCFVMVRSRCRQHAGVFSLWIFGRGTGLLTSTTSQWMRIPALVHILAEALVLFEHTNGRLGTETRAAMMFQEFLINLHRNTILWNSAARWWQTNWSALVMHLWRIFWIPQIPIIFISFNSSVTSTLCLNVYGFFFKIRNERMCAGTLYGH